MLSSNHEKYHNLINQIHLSVLYSYIVGLNQEM